MLSRGFKIVQPKRFEVYIEEVEPSLDDAVVRIESAAVCKADLRYYIGNRDERVLGLKYPINLIHEAIGTVVKDSSGIFNNGDKVALVPNIIPKDHDKEHCEICSNERLGENYCPKALFASSNYNGFSKEYISYPLRNLVKIDKGIDPNVAVFSELISVAHSSIRRIKLKEGDVIGIWGDGILGYILCSVLKQIHKGQIIVVGHNKDKLGKLKGVKTYLSNDTNIKRNRINVAFECIGGAASEKGIEEIINTILPGGKIILTGVAENTVGINTRKVLEKGLSLYGVTRSNVEDFKFAANLLKNEEFYNDISKLIIKSVSIYNIKDYYKVFEEESHSRLLGKRIMNFKL